MDPLRIVARVLFAYVMLLVLMRLSGKHTLKQGSAFDFTLALVLGDMVDDMIWAEVNASAFVVGTLILLLAHRAADRLRLLMASRR
jgi:uncharacterized membrane protein YcaP (DUF421 family)